jgi:rhamnulokinase
MLRVLAVDLGASSGRVAAVDIDARPLEPEIIARFEHAPVRHADGSLRWDWDAIVGQVTAGLERGLAAGPVASIGIDTWGVDYGLLGADGRLLSAPYCYRDARTDGWRDVVARIGEERLYRATGVQLMQINTIFQLAAHDRGELARASRLLMLPELLVHALTGFEAGEVTSAGTTGLVDLATGDWSRELLDAIGVDAAIMPPIRHAGAEAGCWRGVPVRLVGGHDTASAFAGAAAPRGAAVISSGTWMLVGVERGTADVSEAARRANFSNEPGALGGYRFLKNVMGLWMLEQCRARWGGAPLHALLDEVAALPAGGPTVDATDARFLAPADMEAEVRVAAGLPSSASRAAVARCVLDSLATAAARVIGEIEALTGARVPEIIVVGGGARNTLLSRLIEEACGRPVRVGAVEATVLGNAMAQGKSEG